ncbi:hypothetical protein H671_1g4030, partial [Cricetulus griseus]
VAITVCLCCLQDFRRPPCSAFFTLLRIIKELTEPPSPHSDQSEEKCHRNSRKVASLSKIRAALAFFFWLTVGNQSAKAEALAT